MAGQFGLAPQTCQVAVEAWCNVRVIDLDSLPRELHIWPICSYTLICLAGDDPDVHAVSSDDDTAAKQPVVAQQDVAQQIGHEIVIRFASATRPLG